MSLFPISSLQHLPSNKYNELVHITEVIKKTNLAEIIILFGSYARGDFSLKQGEWSGAISDFDFLILTSGKKQRWVESEIKKALEKSTLEIETEIEIICEEVNTMKNALAENRYFYSDIHKEGIVLYDTHKFILPDPSSDIDSDVRFEIATKDFEVKYEDILIFLDAAKYQESKKHYRKASFEIQQIFECSYKLIDLIYTQYSMQEHKLFSLRKKVSKYDSRLNTVFPLDSEKNKKLFHHLCKAYIGSRYHKPELYDVTRDQVLFWIEEAEKIIQLTKIICREKIELLRKNTL